MNKYQIFNFNKEEFDKIFDLTNEEKEIFTPHVIEPSFGIGRIMYCILEHNFRQRSNKNDYHVWYF